MKGIDIGGLGEDIWIKESQIRAWFSMGIQTADSVLFSVGPSARVVTGCWSFTGSRIHWK